MNRESNLILKYIFSYVLLLQLKCSASHACWSKQKAHVTSASCCLLSQQGSTLIGPQGGCDLSPVVGSNAAVWLDANSRV